MLRPGPAIAAICLVALAGMSLWLAFAPAPESDQLVPFSGEVITLVEERIPTGERRWDLTVHSFPPALRHTAEMPGFDAAVIGLRSGSWVTGLAEWSPGQPTATCWALRSDRQALIDYQEMLAWHRDTRGFGVPWLLVLMAVGALVLAGRLLLRKAG